MKKIIYIIWGLIFSYINVFATLDVVCNGLPGCKTETALGTKTVIGNNTFFTFLGNIISEGIKYVAVISIFSLMFAGVLYIISGGHDEKFDQAKRWITYSLVGVLISVSGWAFINLLNSFKIN